MDHAREAALGNNKIGTTGRGIGPAYEDKVARRGLRVGDLFNREAFAEKLKNILDYYNFQLVNYYKAEPVDYQKTLDDVFAVADIITGMVADITTILHNARQKGDNILFEGAQGTMLDVDHGTYPFVTSSNHCRRCGDRFRIWPAQSRLCVGYRKSLLHPRGWRSVHYRIVR